MMLAIYQAEAEAVGDARLQHSIAERVAQLLADPTFEPELLAESQRGTELPWWFGQLRTDVAYARPQKMSVSAYRG